MTLLRKTNEIEILNKQHKTSKKATKSLHTQNLRNVLKTDRYKNRFNPQHQNSQLTLELNEAGK